MQWLTLLTVTALLSLTSGGTPPQKFQDCLSQGIKPSDVVSATMRKPGVIGHQVTVEQKLKELRARCRRGKLVDARGREIYFYRLQGCWGNPPSDYQEILQRQDQEIRRLKKLYTVIEMTCNPSGVQIP